MEDVTSSFGESSMKSSHIGAMEEDWMGEKVMMKDGAMMVAFSINCFVAMGLCYGVWVVKE